MDLNDLFNETVSDTVSNDTMICDERIGKHALGRGSETI